MVTTSLTFNPADVARFRDVMNSAVTRLGKTPREAVRWGTILFLQSVRASTKQARKQRPARTLKSGATVVTGYFFDAKLGAPALQKRTFSANTPPAILAKVKKVHYAGLAKKSWGWAMQDLFSRSPGTGAFRRVRDVSISKEDGKGNDYAITVTNKLDYAEQAFRTKGRSEITTALARAARGMEHNIVRKLDKGK